MKTKKSLGTRILSLLLTLLMVTSLIPLSTIIASAEVHFIPPYHEETVATSNGFTVTINNIRRTYESTYNGNTTKKELDFKPRHISIAPFEDKILVYITFANKYIYPEVDFYYVSMEHTLANDNGFPCTQQWSEGTVVLKGKKDGFQSTGVKEYYTWDAVITYTPSSSHNFDGDNYPTVEKVATCTETGTIIQKCQNGLCQHTRKKTTPTDNNAHIWGDWKQADNNQHSRTCTRNGCGKIETATCESNLYSAACGTNTSCTTCGRDMGIKQHGGFLYDVKDNKIHSTCLWCNTDLYVELVADNTSYEYTGKPIQPYKLKYTDNWMIQNVSLEYDSNTTDSRNGVKCSATYKDALVEFDYLGNSIIYEDLTISKTFDIVPATPTLTAPTANTLVYNGQEQNLITAGSTTDGVMMYSLDGKNWSQHIPTAKTVGKHTVYYKVDGDNNHKDSEVASIDVVISCTHDGDEATCLHETYCTICGELYQAINPYNHESNDCYIQSITDDAHGYYLCCCDTLILTEEHTPSGHATCTAQDQCSVCFSLYGNTNGKVHSGELTSWDITNSTHAKKWTCCGAIEGTYEKHNPDFVISEDGTTLSATCSDCKTELGSCSIDFEDGVVYDGKKHKATQNGYIYGAYGSDTLYITYWQNGEKLNIKNYVGISNAGDYTIRLGTADNSIYIEKDVTIQKRELTVDSIRVRNKAYDGTNVMTAYDVNFNNAVEGEEIFGGIYGTIVVNDSEVGYYETVTGIESIKPFVSWIESYYGDNYYVTVDPNAEYPVENGCYIDRRTLTIKVDNQSIIEGDSIDQSKFTVENLPEGYELSGVVLEANEWNNVIEANTENITVTLNGVDVTENFDYYTYSGILETVCKGHTFDKDGFCSTRNCNVYQTPSYTLDEFGIRTYTITNAGELYFYANQVNTYGLNEIGAVLEADIDIPLTKSQGGTIPDWTPIDNLYSNFDGNGHYISGLYVDSEYNYVGLFGQHGYYDISNLTIKNSYFKGNDYVGAIAGYTEGNITNCAVLDDVKVIGSTCVGGLIGETMSSNEINNCMSLATVEGEYFTGGLIGFNYSYVNNCYTNQSSLLGDHSDYYGAEVTNSYYVADEETDSIEGTTAVSADIFATGELAYILQSGVTDEDIYDDNDNSQIWGQTIGTDSYPVIGGKTVYKVNNCSGEIAYNNTNESGGHTHETIKGYDATCEKDGLTDGVKCSVCDEIITAQEVIPKTNHTAIAVPGYEATCQKEGLTAGYKCNDCNKVILAQEVIPKKEHTEEVVKGYIETCSKDGLSDGIKCSVCKETLVEQEVIPSSGHIHETINGYDATCTESGLTDGVNCFSCGCVITPQEVIAPNGHSYDTNGYCTDCGTKAPVQDDDNNKLYFKPSSNWKNDDARFVAYVWTGDSNKFIDLNDTDGDGYYEFVNDSNWENIIFCRLSSFETTITENWSNVWNQTDDLVIPTDGNNCYTVAEGAWSNGNGTWSKYTPTVNYEMGDIDLDGIVSIRDVSTLSKYLVGCEALTTAQLDVADVNGDGYINIKDATHIQKMIAELI